MVMILMAIVAMVLGLLPSTVICSCITTIITFVIVLLGLGRIASRGCALVKCIHAEPNN